MHDLAKIATIQAIEPIPGKDRIVLATVENYKSIVKKDEFKEGDRVIYIFYDAILPPRPEFEFLRTRCWSEKYQGFRIKPIKMGGVISEGLVVSTSLLGAKGDSLPVGTVVTKELGIRAYDPDAAAVKIEPRRAWWMRCKPLARLLRKLGFGKPKKAKGYPALIPKADEENIEKLWDSIRMRTDEFVITEKMEGSAAMYSLDRKGRLHCYSHNWEVGNSGIWGTVAKDREIRKALLTLRKAKGKDWAIEGEICGPGIQKNIYHFSGYRLFLYAAYRISDGRRASWKELKEISAITGLETVPFIRKGPILPSLDEMLKDCEGNSCLPGCGDVPREGLVWRTEDGSLHFKCKSRPYKVWFA